jgi:hypothetical protein
VAVAVAGTVAVGKGVASGAGAGDWQAIRKMRHPMISFFMALIKTQLPGALFQAIVIRDGTGP